MEMLKKSNFRSQKRSLSGFHYGLGRLSLWAGKAIVNPFQATKINIMPTFAANPADEVLPQVSSGASGEKDWPMVQIIL